MIRRALVVAGGTPPDASSALLDLVRWARVERDVEVTAVLLDRGPAATRWAEVAEVHQPPVPVAGARAVSRVLSQPRWGRIADRAWLHRHLAEADRYDVVVVASTAAPSTPPMSSFKSPSSVLSPSNPLADEAVDELQRENKSLRIRVADLDSQVADLTDRVAQTEQALRELRDSLGG